MPKIRVYISPAALIAATILLWITSIYLGFIILPSLPLSPFGVFILFLTILTWLGAITLTTILILGIIVS
jgi:hypothetical protein